MQNTDRLAGLNLTDAERVLLRDRLGWATVYGVNGEFYVLQMDDTGSRGLFEKLSYLNRVNELPEERTREPKTLSWVARGEVPDHYLVLAEDDFRTLQDFLHEGPEKEHQRDTGRR